MTYVTVFDIATSSFPFWWLAALPPVVVAFTFAVRGLAANAFRRRLAMSTGLVTGVGFALGFAYAYAEYATLSAARNSGQYKTIEGTTSDFREAWDEDSPRESFSVNGAVFDYSSNALTSAFHDIARNGGPIRPGQRVRIGHVDGKIIKLEIAADDVASGSARDVSVPVGPGLSPEELRRAEPVLLFAALLFCARFWLNADTFLRFGYTLASFATGFPPARWLAVDAFYRTLVVLGVGVSAAQLTFDLLTVPHPLSDYQAAVAPIIFFIVMIVLFEGLARFVVRHGGRYAPS